MRYARFLLLGLLALAALLADGFSVSSAGSATVLLPMSTLATPRGIPKSTALGGLYEEWVARYNGSGNGRDEATAMALDAGGRVYVTGESYTSSADGYDWRTIGYDPLGSEVYNDRVDGLVSGSNDEPWDIAVDSSGGIWTAGRLYEDTSFGNQYVWAYRYRGPLGSCVGISAFAFYSPSSGGIHPPRTVAPYPGGDAIYAYGSSDYEALRKNGCSTVWEVTFDSGDFDVPRAVAADSAGNVYVTGWSWSSDTGFDYATVKYDPNGDQLWVSAPRYNGPVNGQDVPYALAIDSGGNVYVTGESAGSGTGRDYATVKYSPNGDQLWVSRYNGPGNGDDLAYGVGVDSAGSVYVTGWSVGSGTGYDYATMKYGPNGNQLWVDRYNGPGNWDDVANAMALDAEGNVYVTGESANEANFDYLTLKYGPDGVRAAEARYDGPGHGDDEARDIAVDAGGNVYVTGSSQGMGTDADYATIKYSPASDGDGDGVSDDVDNCPAWPNPDQSLPPWPVPAGDPDCDGFTDTEEAFVGTDPADACPHTPDADDEADDCWPADFDDNQTVNILDFLQLTPPVFNSCSPDPPYTVRKDLNADGCVNILDFLKLTPPVFNSSCTP